MLRTKQVWQRRMITRRQLLKLGAGLSATTLAAGCRSLLDRVAALPPIATPSPTSSLMATLDPSPLPTATAPAVPIETPQATATARPTWIAPEAGSKIGLHVVFGPRAGIDECLWWCALSGHPMAVIKCVDDFEVAFKAKRYSDKTLTVGRVNAVFPSEQVEVDMQAWEPPESRPAGDLPYATAQEAARQYYDLVKPFWQLNPVVDVWETFNEFSWHWPWQADFYVALMDLAEADGYRLGLWSASAGNPPEEFYPDIARASRRAKAHGDHILCLHEYNLYGLLKDGPPDMVTRYRRLYRYLEQVDAIIPLVISEAGENAGGGFTGVEAFMDDFAWYDAQLSKDDYVIGCAAWTLGDWSGANFQVALPALADYIAGRPLSSRTFLPLLEVNRAE
jgi:hypothetical protein